MYERVMSRAGALALVGVFAALVGLLALAGGSAAAVPGCGAFGAQGDAQDAFLEAGGSPSRNAGEMDPDGDGVACEGLPAPFKGYATIGYNRKKQFFYGIATMPAGAGGGEAPCLYGNKNFPEASRRVNIYRVRSGDDKPMLGRYRAGAEAKPELAKLIWKAERSNPIPGRYYVVFDERVPLNPFGRNECPSFSSQPTALPRPRPGPRR